MICKRRELDKVNGCLRLAQPYSNHDHISVKAEDCSEHLHVFTSLGHLQTCPHLFSLTYESTTIAFQER